MKHSKVLLLIALFIGVFFAGCGSVPSAQEPTTLQVTRMDNLRPDNAVVRSWTITDAQAIQNLFQEGQNLPTHQNRGADSCARSHYSYTLDFLAGTKSLQKSELYTYCFTLTLEDGSHLDPTETFTSELAGMLRLSTKELIGW